MEPPLLLRKVIRAGTEAPERRVATGSSRRATTPPVDEGVRAVVDVAALLGVFDGTWFSVPHPGRHTVAPMARSAVGTRRDGNEPTRLLVDVIGSPSVALCLGRPRSAEGSVGHGQAPRGATAASLEGGGSSNVAHTDLPSISSLTPQVVLHASTTWRPRPPVLAGDCGVGLWT